MQLFYNSNISETDTIVHFDKDESRHIVKVLRKNTGDTLHITNGKGWLFTTKLSIASPKQQIGENGWKLKRLLRVQQ